MKVLEKHSGN